MSRAGFHRLPVQSLEPLTDDAVALTFAVPPELAAAYRFEAGQHLTIRGEDGVRRSYSLCTTPASGVLRVGIKRLPDGAFSRHVLDRLRPGDTLDVMTPTGRFTTRLDPERARHCVGIAAGSGITPVLSVLGAVLETEPHSRVTLVYANRDHRSVMFLDEVNDLKDTWPSRVQVVHVLTREPGESELLSGRLDADRTKRLLGSPLFPVGSTEVDDWFLCGPQPMVTGVREALLATGVEASRVRTELFHADPPAVQPSHRPAGGEDTRGAGARVSATLDGRTSSFRLPSGDPVLTGMLQVRADAPYACRGGVCGTCRARVVRGSVSMTTNWALEEEELAAGYVLTCQSHPTTDELVLDYDA